MTLFAANALAWVYTLLLLWLPGAFLVSVLRLPSQSDWVVRFTLQIGLGIAFWPLCFLWSSLLIDLGWLPAWYNLTARLLVGILALEGVGVLLFVSPQNWQRRRRALWRQSTWFSIWAILFFLAVLTRWEHVRQLVLPNWIDSVHHTMLVRLMVEQGRLPDSYAPFLTGSFRYHWGFHALGAWLSWLAGTTEAIPIAQLLLQFGQVLNTLMLFALYAAGRTLFQSRAAGFFAATLGIFISWYPAYYVSWGRYPQLVGLFLFAPLLIAFWKIETDRQQRVNWSVAASLMLAGLFLIHVRILFFAAVLLAILGGWLVFQRAWKTLLWWGGAVITAAFLVWPWLIRLARPDSVGQPLVAAAEADFSWRIFYDAIPWSLIWVPGMREVLAAATGGISGILGWGAPSQWVRIGSGLWLLILLGAFAWRFRQGVKIQGVKIQGVKTTFKQFPGKALLLMILWLILTVLLLNLPLVGLPRLNYVTMGAAVITLFAPLSLAGAGLFAWVVSCIPCQWRKIVTISVVSLMSLWGASQMRSIVNEATVLAGPEDLTAFRWIHENLPQNVKFAVSTFRWQGSTYAGSDGGYWIPVLADRAIIVPPALYTLVNRPATVLQINALLESWSTARSLDDPMLRQRLHDAGVTHLYIGSRGTHLPPLALFNKPFVHLIYQQGSVYIFELR